jgi:hypothetical protein
MTESIASHLGGRGGRGPPTPSSVFLPLLPHLPPSSFLRSPAVKRR